MELERLVLIEYNPKWKILYRQEVPLIQQALKYHLLALHHIGSTAVPGAVARPIIDICAEVSNIEEVDEHFKSLEELGYLGRGEHGIRGQRYFCKKNPQRDNPHLMDDLFHLNLFQQGSMHIEERLIFRDYLCKHSEAVIDYNRIKLELEHKHKGNRIIYTQGKERYIRSILATATYDMEG